MSGFSIRMSGRSARRLQGVAVALVAALAVTVPFGSAPFVVHQLSLLLVYAVALLGLNLLVGYSGQVSLAHSVFFAVGAYTGAILVTRNGVHWSSPIAVTAVLTFVLGFLAGLPVLRLKGLYLAMVTFAMALAVPPLAIRFEALTGGNHGIVVAPESFAAAGLAPDQMLYYLCLVVAAVALVVSRNLVRGRLGLALAAVRVNELAAAAHGVSPARVKTLTFAWSAMYAGMSGCLFAYVTGFVAPESFTYIVGISMLAAAVISGVHSLAGAFVGAAYMAYLPQVADLVNPALVGVAYGLALIAVVLIAPQGLVGMVKAAASRWIVVAPAPEIRHSGPEPHPGRTPPSTRGCRRRERVPGRS